jgi:hypothetical protein
MRQFLLGTALTLTGILGWTSSSEAQVFVRAPFVRVFVGGPGVGVRAPFVNLWIPNINYPPSVMYVPPPPPAGRVAPPLEEVPQNNAEIAPQPRPAQASPMTLDQFAKSFQARPGNYQVTLINPVTKTPTNVSFTLPEGSPRRVAVRRDQIVFNYGRLHFVRIDFDADGAIVTSR